MDLTAIFDMGNESTFKDLGSWRIKSVIETFNLLIAFTLLFESLL